MHASNRPEQEGVEPWTLKLTAAASSGDVTVFAEVFANIVSTCEGEQVRGILQQRDSAGITVLMQLPSGRARTPPGVAVVDAVEAGLANKVRLSEAGRVLTFRMALQCLKLLLR
eukprot:g9968.t1